MRNLKLAEGMEVDGTSCVPRYAETPQKNGFTLKRILALESKIRWSFKHTPIKLSRVILVQAKITDSYRLSYGFAFLFRYHTSGEISPPFFIVAIAVVSTFCEPVRWSQKHYDNRDGKTY